MSDAATIKLSANAARLLGTDQPQVLWEGGVGTGKTFTLCVALRLFCEIFPGIRILLLRQTRIGARPGAPRMHSAASSELEG